MAATLHLRLWSSKIKFLLQQPKPNIFPFTITSYKPFSSHSLLSTTHLPKRVGTHNGSYHCDEALGCFLLCRTAKFADSKIIRSRDLQVLDSLDAVLDVGGVYDPYRNRYDHHQEGFDEVFGHGFGTSAGLVYQHYGKEIVAKEIQLEQGDPDVHRLFLAVYKNFVEAIDAVDNGVNQYNMDLSPKYVINTYLSSRVGRLNLDWTELDQSAERENEAFQRAMLLAGNEFLESIHSMHSHVYRPDQSFWSVLRLGKMSTLVEKSWC